jgi:hypothetical protein
MKKLLTTITLLCFSVGANAQLIDEFKAFLKVTDPNVLEYYYVHDETECLWAGSEARQIIEGVIKRSRIRTSEGIGGVNEIYLSVYVNCMALSDNFGYAAYFNVKYGDYPLLYDRPYGGMLVGGINDKSRVLDSLQSMIGDAITDFVEVNFLSDSN